MVLRPYILAMGLCVIFLAGCPSIWQTKTPPPDTGPEELYKAALRSFDEKRYTDAADQLQRLRHSYPDFEKMPEVYLRIGDAFFNDGKYEEAFTRYRQFIELYPNHQDKYRAKYMIGMAHFKQIKSIDLDDTAIRRAEEAFKEVKDDPEASEWAKKAEEKYRECRVKLAQKELYKAASSLSRSQYKAARLALQRVIDDFADQAPEVVKEARRKLESIKGK
ncbi:MAG: outer membrane protein assembly factor BamD [Desulfomonile sp.]|nr:outer membrane protein assembly factor BamD [Desulfomonile sp.]